MDKKGLPSLIALASIIVILAGLKAAETIVIPLMLALFVAIITTPLLRVMTRHKVPSFIAIIIILFILIIVGSILSLIVTQSVNTFLEQLPQYQKKLEQIIVNISPILEDLRLPVNKETLLESLNISSVMGFMGQTLSTMQSILTNTFLVVFIVIFLLMEEASLPKKLQTALPKANDTLDTASTFVKRVNKYLFIKTTISFITGILVASVLLFIGVDFPILWGLIAMLMNFIPNVGSLIAAIPAVLLAMIQLSFADAGIVALSYVVINVMMGNLIEPRFMGKGLGLSPLVVFLSLIFWGWLFGLVGMFLSIPLTMIVKIALEQNPSTLWIAIMLGDEPPPKSELPKQSAKLVKNGD